MCVYVCVCVCDSLHQQLEGGCALRGSYVWVTAAEETGVQTGQTEHLSPAAGGNSHCTYVCIYIFASRSPSCGARKSRMRLLVLPAFVCLLYAFVCVTYVAGCVYIYILVGCMFALYAYA